MKKEAVIAAGTALFDELPADVKVALTDVRIEVAEAPNSTDVLILLTEESINLDEQFPSDAQGVYLGTQPEPSDDETDDAEPPKGLIILFACNLDSEERVKLTLAHEIGHALGLSEEEVEGLDLF